MPGLEDYGALLRSGQAAVPDYAADEARKQLLALHRAQEQRLTAEAQRETQEQQGFQNDLTTVLAHPSAQGYSALIAKHPKFAQQVKASWDLLDKKRQDSDLQAMSEVYSAAANGKHDLAAALMQRRIDGDKTAGQDSTHDQAILDALNSGDPVQQKGALGMIGVTLSAVTGPDHFEQTLGALTKGTTPDIRNVNAGDDVISVDPLTHKATSIYRSPYVKTADGGILERDGAGGGIVATGPAPTNAYDAAVAMGMDPKLLDPRLKTIPSTGGGDPASPGAATTTAPGGFDHAVEHVLSNEGGYNPSDMNGAPVNFGINQKANPGVDVKNLTKDQARQIYHDKYWVPSGAESLPANLQAPYFDVYIRNPAFAKKALAQSGGDPAKFMQASSAYFERLAKKPSGQPYAQAWATRDAKNTAIATGATEPSPDHPTQGQAPPGYHWLTPPKPKDAPSGYQWSADRSSVVPIPGGPADPNGVKNAGPLKPDALRTATIGYIKTGKMPAGMGGQALKNQILNYVPQIMDEHGLTPDDMPSIQQQFGADSAAFKQRVGQLSYMRQSVGKLNQHAQDLSALIKAVPAQGSFKPFNWITQGVEGQFSNSTIIQLQAGLPLFQAEVARVMTGNPNSGAGQLSDDARHEFSVLSGTASPSAKIDAINRIMKMTEEAVKATRDETGTLKGRIGGGIDVYAGDKPQAQPHGQDAGWITLPSGRKIRKIH